MGASNLITIDNEAGSATDLFSYSDKKLLPKKFPCFDDELGCADEACPDCVGDTKFNFVVFDDSTIKLQFQFDDLVSTDPTNPTFGWRTDSGNYWIELQVIDDDNTVVWEGDTGEISSMFYVGWHQDVGTFQNVFVDMEKLLDEVPGLKCFYFKVRVRNGYSEYNVVQEVGNWNFTSTFPDTTDNGALVLDLTTGQFYVNSNGDWRGSPIVVENGTIYYNQQDGTWGQYDGSDWNGIAAPTSDPDAQSFSECRTYWYVRQDEEKAIAVRFRSDQSEKDCEGYWHGLGGNIYPSDGGAVSRRITPFDHDFMVGGSLEPVSMPIEKEYTDLGRFDGATIDYKYQLRTTGLPFKIAQIIASIMLSEKYYVDEIEFNEADELEKNNEDGEYWWLDGELTKLGCEVKGSGVECNTTLSFGSQG